MSLNSCLFVEKKFKNVLSSAQGKNHGDITTKSLTLKEKHVLVIAPLPL